MNTHASSRLGRPAEFRDRTRLQVFLERTELTAVQQAAAQAGVSASYFARRALVAAVARRPRESRRAR